MAISILIPLTKYWGLTNVLVMSLDHPPPFHFAFRRMLWLRCRRRQGEGEGPREGGQGVRARTGQPQGQGEEQGPDRRPGPTPQSPPVDPSGFLPWLWCGWVTAIRRDFKMSPPVSTTPYISQMFQSLARINP